ncbi:MAG: hypothetical protein LRY50_16545 [Geovibrio sp.]|nr:hypothetical protein [Geovibrio sp.]
MVNEYRLAVFNKDAAEKNDFTSLVVQAGYQPERIFSSVYELEKAYRKTSPFVIIYHFTPNCSWEELSELLSFCEHRSLPVIVADSSGKYPEPQ